MMNGLRGFPNTALKPATKKDLSAIQGLTTTPCTTDLNLNSHKITNVTEIDFSGVSTPLILNVGNITRQSGDLSLRTLGGNIRFNALGYDLIMAAGSGSFNMNLSANPSAGQVLTISPSTGKADFMSVPFPSGLTSDLNTDGYNILSTVGPVKITGQARVGDMDGTNLANKTIELCGLQVTANTDSIEFLAGFTDFDGNTQSRGLIFMAASGKGVTFDGNGGPVTLDTANTVDIGSSATQTNVATGGGQFNFGSFFSYDGISNPQLITTVLSSCSLGSDLDAASHKITSLATPTSSGDAATKGYVDGRTITLSGDASGSGTSAITVTLPTVNSNVGTYNNVTVNAKGQVTAASNVSYLTGNQTITLSGDASGSGATAITVTLPTVNSNVGTYNNVTVNGKGLVTAASNVSYLTGNQTITLSGDASGSGSTAITVTLPTVNSNVGTYNNVTVNAKGQVTAASNVSYLTGNQTVTLSGDVSGSGTTAITATLATQAGLSAGTYNSVTVNTKGIVTAATNVPASLGTVYYFKGFV